MAGLERDGVFCRLVKVDVASHSPQMEPLAATLAQSLHGCHAGGRQPVYRSSRRCSAARPMGGDSTPAIGARNMREPVLFD